MLKPINDRVVLKPIRASETTDNGLFLVESAREATLRAEVLAVGPGRLLDSGEREEISVDVGDTVIVNANSNNATNVSSGELVILSAGDILAVIETNEKGELNE